MKPDWDKLMEGRFTKVYNFVVVADRACKAVRLGPKIGDWGKWDGEWWGVSLFNFVAMVRMAVIGFVGSACFSD